MSIGLNTILTQEQARTIARDYLWQFTNTREKAAEAVGLCCCTGSGTHTSSARDLVHFAIACLDHVPHEHRSVVLKEALLDLEQDDLEMIRDVASELLTGNT